MIKPNSYKNLNIFWINYVLEGYYYYLSPLLETMQSLPIEAYGVDVSLCTISGEQNKSKDDPLL